MRYFLILGVVFLMVLVSYGEVVVAQEPIEQEGYSYIAFSQDSVTVMEPDTWKVTELIA